MSRDAVRAITADERDAYGRDGVVLLKGLTPGDWVVRMRDAANEGLGAEGGAFRVLWNPQIWNAAFQDYVWDSGVSRAAASLLADDDLRLMTAEVWAKDPGAEEPIKWHNDISYYPWREADICSVWLALVDVSPEMSAMRFVPGSHRWKRMFKPHVPSAGGDSKARFESAPFEELPDFAGLSDRFPGLINEKIFDMKAGDAVAFTGWTLHHTGANRSPKRRIAYSVRFLGEHGAVFDPRSSTSWPAEAEAALARGASAVAGFPAVLQGGRPAQKPPLRRGGLDRLGRFIEGKA